MNTMRDVAKIAGVSVATVSHVINGTKKLRPETVSRVEAAISQACYTPNAAAKTLRRGKSFTVGVIAEDIRGLPVPNIVDGISEALENKGYQMIFSDLHLMEKLYNQYEQIGNYHGRINRGISLLLHANVDGVVYVGMHDRPLDGVIDPIAKPLVLAYAHGNGADYVTYNNKDAAMQATEHLIGMGHTKIALIAGPPNSYPTRQRFAGFRMAMEKASLPIRKQYILYGDWELAAGERGAETLLRLPDPPTAVFAMNDNMAIGCMRTFIRGGLRVPEDISVVGFDDREIASYSMPELTTIQLPTVAIGKESVELLFETLSSPDVLNQSRILNCTLIERASVCPPRRANP